MTGTLRLIAAMAGALFISGCVNRPIPGEWSVRIPNTDEFHRKSDGKVIASFEFGQAFPTRQEEAQAWPRQWVFIP